MKELSRSPGQYSDRKTSYLKRKAEEGKTPDNDDDVRSMLEMFDFSEAIAMEIESKTEWKENNLEYDLRTTDWILEKTRNSEVYSQNLYAAMCNREFQKNDVINILKNTKWSCSWRHAGGIVANMREEGDYIDWYCSGIRDTDPLEESEYENLTDMQKARYEITKRYVGESIVTDEIKEDLKTLGWIVLDNSDELI